MVTSMEKPDPEKGLQMQFVAASSGETPDTLKNNTGDDSSILIGIQRTKPAPLLLVVVFMASVSGFMFGYDTGYISSALVSIGTDLSNKTLTTGNKEFITSATSLGAILGSIIAGSLADTFGRKWTIFGSNILFILGSGLQTGSHSVWQMIGGRFVMGWGVGIGSLTAPLYISEMSPSSFRGRLVIINCLSITGGQLIAYGIGAGLNHVNNGWRILVGISIIPPFIQMIVFFFLPDTPRYLVQKGFLEEAENVILKTHRGTTPEMVKAKIDELIDSTKSGFPDDTPHLKLLLLKIKKIHHGANFRALVLATGMQGIQQFTGFNSLMYFSSTIFESVGFNNATAVSIIVAGTNFVFTILAFFIIDIVGRRRILLVTIPGMCAALVLNAIAFHFVPFNFNGDELVSSGSGISGWGIVILVGMMLYIAFYAAGIGNVPWQQSELFPMSVRGLGVSYATATNWSGSLVISSTFLTMLENITPTGTFALFAAICAVSFFFIFFLYPELSNLELEETQLLLTDGFNIKLSLQMAKERKERLKRQKHNEHHDNASQISIEVLDN